MNKLTLCEKEVNSLHEIREKLTPAEVYSAFRDGSLEKWLENCCYETQYSDIRFMRQDESLETFRYQNQ